MDIKNYTYNPNDDSFSKKDSLSLWNDLRAFAGMGTCKDSADEYMDVGKGAVSGMMQFRGMPIMDEVF